MDHDAMNRHVQNLNRFKERAEKVVAFVEQIMTKDGVNPDVDAKQSLVDDISAMRTDITKIQDSIDEFAKFKADLVPVLDQLPKFQELMAALEAAGPQLQLLAGVDFAKNEERLTAVEGKAADLEIEVDQLVTSLDAPDATDDTATKEPVAGSDGATPGQTQVIGTATGEGPTGTTTVQGTLAGSVQEGLPMAPGAEGGVGELSPAKPEPSAS